MSEAAIKEKRTDTYEEIYYALWEMNSSAIRNFVSSVSLEAAMMNG